MINQDTIRALREAIEKCGGPGGTPGPCPGPRKPKPPKKPTKPEGPNGSYSRQQLQAHNQQKPKPKPKKPPKKPAPLSVEGLPQDLVKELKVREARITKSRKKVLQLAKKLGFKPTSRDSFVNEQQALEWAQLRAAKATVRGKTSDLDINPRLISEAGAPYRPIAAPKAPPKAAAKPSKLPVSEPAAKPNKKPPKDPVPPKKPPGKRPVTDPKTGQTTTSKKKALNDPVTEAKAIVELSQSPALKKIKFSHPSIAKMAGKSFSKIIQGLTGMKSSEVWPNRKQAAKNLVKKMKTEFTDENVNDIINTAVANVKKVFTREGAAARIMSHFLGEKAW